MALPSWNSNEAMCPGKRANITAMQIFSCFIGEMAQLKLLFLGIFYKHKTAKAKFNVDESPKKRYPKYRLQAGKLYVM